MQTQPKTRPFDDSFHPIHGADMQERVRANTRFFVGDGTPYLRCPGLKKILSVRIRHMELPESITREFPLDLSFTRVRDETRPTYMLSKAADGMPVVLRNVVSNDGIWQKGEPIYVEGEWDPKVPDTPPTAEEAKS